MSGDRPWPRSRRRARATDQWRRRSAAIALRPRTPAQISSRRPLAVRARPGGRSPWLGRLPPARGGTIGARHRRRSRRSPTQGAGVGPRAHRPDEAAARRDRHTRVLRKGRFTAQHERRTPSSHDRPTELTGTAQSPARLVVVGRTRLAVGAHVLANRISTATSLSVSDAEDERPRRGPSQSDGGGASSAIFSRMTRISSRSSSSAANRSTSSRMVERSRRRAAASRKAVRTASESVMPPARTTSRAAEDASSRRTCSERTTRQP